METDTKATDLFQEVFYFFLSSFKRSSESTFCIVSSCAVTQREWQQADRHCSVFLSHLQELNCGQRNLQVWKYFHVYVNLCYDTDA